MKFTDTHAHLHFPDYGDEQQAVIDRACEEGIDRFINVGTDVPTSQACLDLARRYDFIYATAGVHPHDAKDCTQETLERIKALLNAPKMVAIGEVGLDFFRDHSPRDVQIKVFKQFLAMQRDTGKPLVIHCRDAYAEMLDILKTYSSGSYDGVMHCFASDAETMKAFIELGFYISFAGPLTYKKNDSLREACKLCPEDRILLETDAPFLPPQSMRGKRNEPSFMLETARVAADVRGVSLEQLAETTSRNATRAFNL